jgi:hypothetical protein
MTMFSFSRARAQALHTLALLVPLLGCCGCSSMHALDLRDDFRLETFNHQIRDRVGRLETVDGREFRGTRWLVLPDSTSWWDSRAGELMKVPTREVSEIVLKRYGRGAGDGLLFGALTGMILGAGLGLTGDEGLALTNEWAMVVLGGFGLVVGGVTGALPGYIIGHSDHYLLNPPELPKEVRPVPGHPPRSSAST